MAMRMSTINHINRAPLAAYLLHCRMGRDTPRRVRDSEPHPAFALTTRYVLNIRISGVSSIHDSGTRLR